jgi:hypothetical protein
VREHRIPNRIVLPTAGVCAVLSLIGGVWVRPPAHGRRAS